MDMRSNSYIQLRFCFSNNLDICIHPTKIYLSNLDITGYGFWICLKVGCPKICEAVNLKISPHLPHCDDIFGSVQTTSYPIFVRLIPIIDGIVPMKTPLFYRFLKTDPKIISSWVLKSHEFPLNSNFF